MSRWFQIQKTVSITRSQDKTKSPSVALHTEYLNVGNKIVYFVLKLHGVSNTIDVGEVGRQKPNWVLPVL